MSILNCASDAPGCNLAINYANSKQRAEEFFKEIRSAYPDFKMVLIQADVGKKSECERLVDETIAALGGLDIIISNAGIRFQDSVAYLRLDSILSFFRSRISRRSLGTSFRWLLLSQDKCFAINIKAHVWLLKTALPTFHNNADGGHLLITGSIAVPVIEGRKY
jgi:NAD(P)-dependent dehydrogenase (short-subunit alcohol dehydrogenase family)